MINKLLTNTGDGATITIDNKNIAIDNSMFSDLYLKLFGTRTEWWGNTVFGTEFNSSTQKAISENSTDERSLDLIKRAIISDLTKIGYASFVVEVITVGNDKVKITITASEGSVMCITCDETMELIITTQTI